MNAQDESTRLVPAGGVGLVPVVADEEDAAARAGPPVVGGEGAVARQDLRSNSRNINIV